MTRHVALRFMTGFRCLGPACEDDCCHGWTVPVDRQHHRLIKLTLAKHGEEQRFLDACGPPPEAPVDAVVAVLRQREDQTCTFLDPERTCELQRRFGEDHLPDGCAMYPRNVSSVGGRIEVTGEISCPEVARRALLAEDATDIVPCEPEVAGRGVVAQSMPLGTSTPYAVALDHVRGAMFGLLTRREHPIVSRLFFIAEFAERIGAFLDRSSTELDSQRLVGEIQRIETDEVLAAIDTAFRGVAAPPALAASVVIKLLAARLEQQTSATFQRVYIDVMKALAAEDSGVELEAERTDSLRVEPNQLGAFLAARREERAAKWGDRLDLHLTNYAKTWVLRDWYIFAPDLAGHVQQLLAKIAMLRFLLLSHPALDDAAAEGPDALDRLAVRVFYSFARTMEHSEKLITQLVEGHLKAYPRLSAAVALLQV